MQNSAPSLEMSTDLLLPKRGARLQPCLSLLPATPPQLGFLGLSCLYLSLQEQLLRVP